MLIILGFIVISSHLLIMQKNYKFSNLDKVAGDLSYPVYILHFVFLGVTLKFLKLPVINGLGPITQFVIGFLINIIITSLIAYIALRLVVDPIDKIREEVRGFRQNKLTNNNMKLAQRL